MRKQYILVCLLVCLTFFGCKKENKNYNVKIITDGGSYTLKAITNEGKEYLNKSVVGVNTSVFSPLSKEDISVSYTSLSGLKIKIYVNDILVNDLETTKAGSGAFNVHD